ILRADKREERLGGAASVASMLASLGAEGLLAGVTGTDHEVAAVPRLLRRFAIHPDLVLPDPDRPTTLRGRHTRKRSARHPHQTRRVDYEVRSPLSERLENDLLHAIDAHLPACAIALVSDYDKGVCTRRLLRHVIDRARGLGKRVLVDPVRGSDY